MKLVIQRVSRASVSAEGKLLSQIGRGICVLVGAEKGDSREDAERLAEKLLAFRIFPDAADKMNLSVREAGGEILSVSQFTLAAAVNKGTRPSFDSAEKPDVARELLEVFNRKLREGGVTVREGSFGARMEVEILNDGPVTFVF